MNSSDLLAVGPAQTNPFHPLQATHGREARSKERGTVHGLHSQEYHH